MPKRMSRSRSPSGFSGFLLSSFFGFFPLLGSVIGLGWVGTGIGWFLLHVENVQVGRLWGCVGG